MADLRSKALKLAKGEQKQFRARPNPFEQQSRPGTLEDLATNESTRKFLARFTERETKDFLPQNTVDFPRNKVRRIFETMKHMEKNREGRLSDVSDFRSLQSFVHKMMARGFTFKVDHAAEAAAAAAEAEANGYYLAYKAAKKKSKSRSGERRRRRGKSTRPQRGLSDVDV